MDIAFEIEEAANEMAAFTSLFLATIEAAFNGNHKAEQYREAFDYLVKNAVLSTYQEQIHIDYPEWKEQIRRSEIRCQWDPERDIFGNPLEYRTIQLGLREKAVRKYVEEWIIHITDISDYVCELKDMIAKKEDVSALLPAEVQYKEYYV